MKMKLTKNDAEEVLHKMSVLDDTLEFCVMVPYFKNFKEGKNLKYVSYPASGCLLYTRKQAIDVLKKFAERRKLSTLPPKKLSQLECWAESEHERFTLEDIP